MISNSFYFSLPLTCIIVIMYPSYYCAGNPSGRRQRAAACWMQRMDVALCVGGPT